MSYLNPQPIARKKTKFTEAQLVFALRQADTGVAVAEVCRKRGISEATYYHWKKKYSGLGVPALRRLKQVDVAACDLNFQVLELDSLRQLGQPAERHALVKRVAREEKSVLTKFT